MRYLSRALVLHSHSYLVQELDRFARIHQRLLLGRRRKIKEKKATRVHGRLSTLTLLQHLVSLAALVLPEHRPFRTRKNSASTAAVAGKGQTKQGSSLPLPLSLGARGSEEEENWRRALTWEGRRRREAPRWCAACRATPSTGRTPRRWRRHRPAAAASSPRRAAPAASPPCWRVFSSARVRRRTAGSRLLSLCEQQKPPEPTPVREEGPARCKPPN